MARNIDRDGGYSTRNVRQPFQGAVVRTNAYWVCVEGDPERAVFFGLSPQCNASEIFVRSRWGLGRIEKATNWKLSVVYIPVAYIPAQE